MSDPKMQPSTNPITELKVSAHLMTMEAGLFCVYNTPGADPADAATGLPGVRITAAPGRGGFPGQVTVSGFNGDGWVGGDAGATLVRITGGAAQVLVTVYQDADGARDAPKLQVIRLSDQPAPQAAAAPAPEAPAPEEASAPQPDADGPIEVSAHIYGRGDVAGRLGEWMGEPGSKRWIEGFGLAPGGEVGPGDIEYQAVLGRGWLSPWAEGGQFCGSRGMSLPILGLRVRLRGDAEAAYAVQVSATFVDGTQIGPVAGGGAVEAPSLSPLEAFRVVLVPSGGAGAGRGRPPAPAAAVKPAGPRGAGRAAKPAAAPAAKPTAAPAAMPKAPAKPAGRKAAEPPAPVTPPAAAKPAGTAKAQRTPATTRRR